MLGSPADLRFAAWPRWSSSSRSSTARTARCRSGCPTPAVYNDHREAAEVGRRLKELEGPYKLATEWRNVHDDLDAARADSDLRDFV